jgi:carbamoyltransferase
MEPGVLGLWDGHDAGVALVAGGELCFALSEERPSRRKRFSGFPRRSLRAALDWAAARGIAVTDVALAGRHGRAPLRLLESWYRRTDPARDPLSPASALVRTWENAMPALPVLREAESRLAALAVRLRAGLPPAPGGAGPRWHLVDHHDAHAFGALLGDPGGEGPAAVVTWDAYGEGRSGSLRSSDNPWNTLQSLPPSAGIAALYGAVTVLQGFGEGDEGKVMGLAACGRPEPARSRFLALFADRDGVPVLRAPLARRGLVRLLEGLSREDAAAGLQAAVEELALRWIDGARRAIPGARRLLLAGGLFGNVLLNRAVASLPGVDACFVFPHMGDGGLPAGAAHAAWHALHGAPARPLRHMLLGPDPDPSSFAGAAATAGLPARRVADPAAEAARHLVAGRVVCRYDGRDEFGPRALGNRSILFPASDPSLPARVNAALRRDGFMPFAPAVHPAEAATAFPGAPSAADLRFMTCCADASAAFRQAFPGGVHVDGTARPQVADPVSAPGLHAVLAACRSAGVAAVVNTSFNLHGEPIVHSPADAVRTFVASGLDVLVLGDLVAEVGHALD